MEINIDFTEKKIIEKNTINEISFILQEHYNTNNFNNQ